MQLTILTDHRSHVMTAAMVLLALLPALVLPIDDAYQPVRAIGVAAVAVLFVVAAGSVRIGRAGLTALALGAGYVVLATIASVAGGLPSGVYGVSGRYQGLVSLAVLAAAGMSALLAGGKVPRRAIAGAALAGPATVMLMLVQPSLGAEPVGLLGNRVIAGAWLAVVAAVLVAGALTASGRARWVLAACAAATALGVGLAGSRGAWLALIVAVVAAAVAARWSNRSLVAGVTVTVVVAVLLGVVFGGDESLTKLAPGSLSSGSAASRTWIWKDTAALVADNPVTGVGPGRFLYVYPAYESVGHVVTEGADKRADQAHSLPLHTAAETGVPGMLVGTALALVALASGFLAVRRRDGVALVALAGMAAYLTQSLFGVAAVELDALGWVLGGVLVARGAAFEQRSESPPAGTSAAARIGVVALATIGVIASLVYVTGDRAYTRSLHAFGTGDMSTAFSEARQAVEAVPLVDTFRVALSDAATYGGGDPVEALRALEAGLELEPMSYDLAIARARMLAFMDAPPDDVADAYEDALGLYPRAVSIRPEVAEAFRADGRTTQAEDLDRPITPAGTAP